MRLKARLKKGCIFTSRVVGCKRLTKSFQTVDVTEPELELFKKSDIVEFSIVEEKEKKVEATKAPTEKKAKTGDK